MKQLGLEPSCGRTVKSVISKSISPQVCCKFSSIGKNNKGTTKRSFKDTRCGQALTGMEERLLTYFVKTYLLWRVGVIVIFLFLLFSVFNSEFRTYRDFNHYLRNFLLFVSSYRLTMAISSKQVWALFII